MFKPKYTISHKLLGNIKKVNTLVIELNSQKIPQSVLIKFEKTAQVISVFASTSIEGNPLPLTEVKKILKSRPENIRQSEKEVLNYNVALKEIDRRLEEKSFSLNLNLILSIHKKVVQGLMPDSQTGRWRQSSVFVNNPKTKKVIYLPPDFKDVQMLMKNLIEFIDFNKAKIDPLILAGIFHKQFVIIHPFMDGNGRSARLVTKALLKDLGLDLFNLFSFENYYNKNVTSYFKEVGAFGNYYDITTLIDFTDWLEYFTDGIIDELLRVKKQILSSVSSPETELKSFHKKILGFIRKKRLYY